MSAFYITFFLIILLPLFPKPFLLAAVVPARGDGGAAVAARGDGGAVVAARGDDGAAVLVPDDDGATVAGCDDDGAFLLMATLLLIARLPTRHPPSLFVPKVIHPFHPSNPASFLLVPCVAKQSWIPSVRIAMRVLVRSPTKSVLFSFFILFVRSFDLQILQTRLANNDGIVAAVV
ncbi:hypothetical protein OsJ_01644 [Oryza sativa Japonica Group]|uniref:Uncharacterized protein n=1 Tax=Oryza sativa subsp. japonica TaxID=39947 RepID=B9EWA1_ORYSJ|nr:hypothetical protein OsJ_01644 [Oryza sativa Japonica Group]